MLLKIYPGDLRGVISRWSRHSTNTEWDISTDGICLGIYTLFTDGATKCPFGETDLCGYM